MTVHEVVVPDDGQCKPVAIELLADDAGEIWTAVPADASDEQRITTWLSVEEDDLCELSEWR